MESFIKCNAPCDHSVSGICRYNDLWRSAIEYMIRRPSTAKENVLQLYLELCGSQTRPELVIHSKFPRSTVYDTLQRMILKGKVKEYHELRQRTGRPMTIYELINLKPTYEGQREGEKNRGEGSRNHW